METLDSEISKGFAKVFAEKAAAGFLDLTSSFFAKRQSRKKLREQLLLSRERYLKSILTRYSKSKIFLGPDSPRPINHFYVPLDLVVDSPDDNRIRVNSDLQFIKDPSFSSCLNVSNRLLIVGTGGSGKSILIKHLLLNCIKNSSLIPIFVELRDLNQSNGNLYSLILEKLSDHGFDLEIEEIEALFESGTFFFALDGFDELNVDLAPKIRKQILSISSRFSNCPIFLSSRPGDSLTELNEFTVSRMRPLKLEKAIKIINKYPAGEEASKKRFCAELRDGMFQAHRTFLASPLLLIMMLNTYGVTADIPTKLHLFYERAFEVLFHRHDASKGGFKRDHKAKLDIQDFGHHFGLFCLVTYSKENYSMSETECLEIIKQVTEAHNSKIKAEDFLFDLKTSVCMLIDDGLNLVFSHRSFQEYFVAKYVARMADSENKKRAIEMISRRMLNDQVVRMFAEMSPETAYTSIIFPYFYELFEISPDEEFPQHFSNEFVLYLFEALSSNLNVELELRALAVSRFHVLISMSSLVLILVSLRSLQDFKLSTSGRNRLVEIELPGADEFYRFQRSLNLKMGVNCKAIPFPKRKGNRNLSFSSEIEKAVLEIFHTPGSKSLFSKNFWSTMAKELETIRANMKQSKFTISNLLMGEED